MKYNTFYITAGWRNYNANYYIGILLTFNAMHVSCFKAKIKSVLFILQSFYFYHNVTGIHEIFISNSVNAMEAIDSPAGLRVNQDVYNLDFSSPIISNVKL